MSSASDDPNLDAAYALETPDDNRELYARWAATYESEFMAARGYEYHLSVADVFVDGSRPDGPVLDVGCGTGVVGAALQDRGVAVVDGVDISPEMLKQAASKGSYRHLFETDLTTGMDMADGTYAGVTSAGTFTHGHLPPEPIGELIRVAMPGARFALGVNAAHFVELGFAAWLDRAVADARIEPYTLRRAKVYADSDPERPDDMSNIVVFTVR